MDMTQQEFKDLSEKVDSIVETLKRTDEIRRNNANIIDNNFVILNEKIDKIENKMNSLHKDTNENIDEVKLEIVKIQKTTGYDEIYNNMHVLGSKKSS